MKKINLTQGKSAIVDDIDYAFLSNWNWCIFKNRNRFYACRNRHKTDEPGPSIVLMHREVARRKRIKGGVDHVNRNGLDNRRTNLRSATASQQARNQGKKRNNTSGYIGIYRRNSGWKVQICINGKSSYLGTFKDKQTAAIVYDLAAKLAHGRFAKRNFSDKQLAAIRRRNRLAAI